MLRHVVLWPPRWWTHHEVAEMEICAANLMARILILRQTWQLDEVGMVCKSHLSLTAHRSSSVRANVAYQAWMEADLQAVTSYGIIIGI